MPSAPDPRTAFIEAAVWHGSLDRARQILAANPAIAVGDIHTAAILGDADAVRRFVTLDPAGALEPAGPLGWDALTHLCFSKYLRLEPERTPGFLSAAEALLDAGASANTGFWESAHQPQPERESALYGAAGVAFHAGLTRLLLERGADPNDGEVTYHAPETYDLGALTALVQTGRLTADSLATMLLRKADWHDGAGIRLLLSHRADPNHMTGWGFTALHQALRRDNALASIEDMLDHGADPARPARSTGQTAAAIAARRGRGDVLAALRRRAIPVELQGLDALLAACASADRDTITAIAAAEPDRVRELIAESGTILAEFAGVGNTDGVRCLLDLGASPAAPYAGDGYYGIAANSAALHVAAWRAHPETVSLLLQRGALPDAPDGAGRTPLALAVRACVDSYWTERRSPESVRALLQAGASVAGIAFPSGYAEVDDLLAAHGAVASTR